MWKSIELGNRRHFSVFNVHITVDKVPILQLAVADRALCECWGSIQDDENASFVVAAVAADPTGADSVDSGFKTSRDSGTYHLQLVADWSPESFGSALTNGVSALLIDATGLESQLDGSVARNRES